MSGLTRRGFLAGAAGVAAGAVLTGHQTASAQAPPARGPTARSVPLSAGWRFGGPWRPGASAPDFDDSAFELVTLPHTVTELSWRRWEPRSWERRWIYRRHVDVPPALDGHRLFVDFDGAMTGATVSCNGRRLGTHRGGYLPFGHELTGKVRREDNVIAVELDSRFALNVPPNLPDVPTTRVDFWQPGGIYRAATLRAVPQTYLADVFAKPVDVLTPERAVHVRCTVDSADAPSGPLEVQVALRRGGVTIAADAEPMHIDEPGTHVVDVRLERLGNIALWDLEHPDLYDVVVTLSVRGAALHDYTTRIGIRDARFTEEGFFLNGERIQLLGVNRHQFYPFAGAAMPNRVHRKDAAIVRDVLRCSMLRCSHYPQAEALLDACDELGLLVWEEAPGWQIMGDADWKARAERDVHDMVVRGRNHPSVVLWGARLNETADDLDLYTRTRDLAHRLDDSRQTTGAMIGGTHATPDFVQDVFSYNDYHVADGHASLLPPRTDRPYLVSEAVGTLSGPAKYYRRTAPAEDQQGQALAHAHVHHIAGSDVRYSGLLAWSGFDYPSGTGNQYDGVKYTGVVDLFREPKPGAAIYRAQVDPEVAPVIEPAFYWDFGPHSPAEGPGAQAMICSNCERLEVFVDDALVADVQPDRGRFGNLRYPPSFVDLTMDGVGRPELRVDGYVAGTRVLSRRFAADPAGDVLDVVADDDRLEADGADATRVAFRVVDRFGAARPFVGGEVDISIEGPGTLVGETPFDLAEAGGVGAVWVRSQVGRPGRVRVSVTHARLGSGTVTIAVRPSPHGGDPVPEVHLDAAATPRLLSGRTTTEVRATLTNLQAPDLTDVEAQLSLPSGWSAEALTSLRFRRVRPDASVDVRWEVRPPVGAEPGDAELQVRTSWRSRGVASGKLALLRVIVPSPVPSVYDNVGTTDDSDYTVGDFDGVGNTYSRQALAAAGLVPGGELRHAGLAFTWPDVAAGAPDNVLAAGQTIELTGTGSRLGFLGATSRGPITGSGTVHYADGSSTGFVVTLDDWFYPPGPDNDVVATMSYINTTNPAKADNGVGGRRTEEVYVFFASVTVDATKQVVGVTLPDVGGTVEGGVPAMHVHAVAVG